MSNVWIRIIIGSLLMVHGFAHWHMTSGWDSNLTDRSWLLAAAGIAPAAIHPIATLLWVAALLAFLCSGGAVL
jgi:uncharacterized membrane protein YphA (DoxX/SURF4 family)